MIDCLPLACLPIQTHIGKATFQFATKWMHDNTTRAPKQSKAKKDATRLLPFAAGNPSLACLPDSLVHSFFRVCTLPSHPVRPGQPTEEQRQASIINHFAIYRANNCTSSGASANAGPHYQKLYARVTHVWGNHKGQPNPSAMKGPRLERTASLITVPPASGKYFCILGGSMGEVQCPPSIKDISEKKK